jgi:DNA-binding PucR family transcriptional regulator
VKAVAADPADVDRELFRELVLRIGSERPGWLNEAAREIADAIQRELPELDVDEEIRASTLTSSESVLHLLGQLVALGRPPGEAEPPPPAVGYARDLVQRGVSIDALLRSYHVGQATFFRRWVALLHETVTDPERLTRAVEYGASWTFDFVQALSRGLVARYSEEREAWVRSAVAVRSDTVRSLLASEPLDPQSASRRLRYELDREHLAYLVWTEHDASAGEYVAELERAALELARALGASGALVVPLSGQMVAAWVAVPGDAAAAMPATQLDRGTDAQAAFGSPGHGIAGFCASHRQALHARRVARLAARRTGSVTRYADVALTALASVDVELATEFVSEQLGPLAGQDDDTVRLTATLRVYLEEQASPRRAAQRLGVHENTIKARIRTVTEQLGRPPAPSAAELLVALRLVRLTHRA